MSPQRFKVSRLVRVEAVDSNQFGYTVDIHSNVSNLTQLALSLMNQKYFEEYLIDELTPEVWQRMDEKSNTFLITARCTYESMTRIRNSKRTWF